MFPNAPCPSSCHVFVPIGPRQRLQAAASEMRRAVATRAEDRRPQIDFLVTIACAVCKCKHKSRKTSLRKAKMLCTANDFLTIEADELSDSQRACKSANGWQLHLVKDKIPQMGAILCPYHDRHHSRATRLAIPHLQQSFHIRDPAVGTKGCPSPSLLSLPFLFFSLQPAVFPRTSQDNSETAKVRTRTRQTARPHLAPPQTTRDGPSHHHASDRL